MKRTTNRITKAAQGKANIPIPFKSVKVIENDKTGVTVVAIEVDLEKLRHLRLLKCSECGKEMDCRKIGAKGAEICYPCACKPENEARSAHNYKVRLSGEGELQ